MVGLEYKVDFKDDYFMDSKASVLLKIKDKTLREIQNYNYSHYSAKVFFGKKFIYSDNTSVNFATGIEYMKTKFTTVILTNAGIRGDINSSNSSENKLSMPLKLSVTQAYDNDQSLTLSTELGAELNLALDYELSKNFAIGLYASKCRNFDETTIKGLKFTYTI